jgi:hypothetical protein
MAPWDLKLEFRKEAIMTAKKAVAKKTKKALGKAVEEVAKETKVAKPITLKGLPIPMGNPGVSILEDKVFKRYLVMMSLPQLIGPRGVTGLIQNPVLLRQLWELASKVVETEPR